MATEEEKKPIVGNEFMRKVVSSIEKKQTGEQGKEQAEEDETETYKRKTRTAQAKHEYVTTVDGLLNPPSVQEMRQEAQKEVREERQQVQKVAHDVLDRERTRLEDDATAAAQKATEEEGRRIVAEQTLQQQQTQMLLDKLDELKKSSKPMEQQLDDYMAFADRIAEKMGYQKVDHKLPTDNPQITLDVTRLQLEMQQEQRKFDWQMQKDKQDFELRLLQLKDDREYRKAQLDLDAKKGDMFANLPQTIGGAFARGLRDQPEPQQQPQQETAPKAYHIELAPGEEGTITCPNCQQPISIADTTTVAQCAGCNSKFAVVRSPSPEGGNNGEEK